MAHAAVLVFQQARTAGHGVVHTRLSGDQVDLEKVEAGGLVGTGEGAVEGDASIARDLLTARSMSDYEGEGNA